MDATGPRLARTRHHYLSPTRRDAAYRYPEEAWPFRPSSHRPVLVRRSATVDGYGHRVFAQDGDDLGLIEHPRENLAAGDLVVDPGGQLALVTAYLPGRPGRAGEAAAPGRRRLQNGRSLAPEE